MVVILDLVNVNRMLNPCGILQLQSITVVCDYSTGVLIMWMLSIRYDVIIALPLSLMPSTLYEFRHAQFYEHSIAHLLILCASILAFAWLNGHCHHITMVSVSHASIESTSSILCVQECQEGLFYQCWAVVLVYLIFYCTVNVTCNFI